MGTVHDDQYTFLITSRLIILRMKNISDRHCSESQNDYFMFCNFVFENRDVYGIM